MKKIVVVGLGNPIISDDGVGIKVAQAISETLQDENIAVKEVYAGGLRLMDALVGFDHAIIIDAMLHVKGTPGTIKKFGVQDFAATRNIGSSHDMDLNSAIELGRISGLKMPQTLDIWGIEAFDILSFSENLTNQVSEAVPKVVSSILHDIKALTNDNVSLVRG